MFCAGYKTLHGDTFPSNRQVREKRKSTVFDTFAKCRWCGKQNYLNGYDRCKTCDADYNSNRVKKDGGLNANY